VHKLLVMLAVGCALPEPAGLVEDSAAEVGDDTGAGVVEPSCPYEGDYEDVLPGQEEEDPDEVDVEIRSDGVGCVLTVYASAPACWIMTWTVAHLPEYAIWRGVGERENACDAAVSYLPGEVTVTVDETEAGELDISAVQDGDSLGTLLLVPFTP
jgi:hypothetical protein